MITKVCIKCGKDLSLNNFYKNKKSSDGYSGKCIECCKQFAKENRLKNIEYYKEYDRNRTNKKERVEQTKARLKKLQETDYEKYYQIKVLANKRWVSKNKNKKRAEDMVKTAIDSGVLIKKCCCFCESTENVEGHHENYDKPLDVMWLCSKCHHELHRFIRNAKRVNC